MIIISKLKSSSFGELAKCLDLSHVNRKISAIAFVTVASENVYICYVCGDSFIQVENSSNKDFIFEH